MRKIAKGSLTPVTLVVATAFGLPLEQTIKKFKFDSLRKLANINNNSKSWQSALKCQM